jgi:hypothetical protein
MGDCHVVSSDTADGEYGGYLVLEEDLYGVPGL